CPLSQGTVYALRFAVNLSSHRITGFDFSSPRGIKDFRASFNSHSGQDISGHGPRPHLATRRPGGGALYRIPRRIAEVPPMSHRRPSELTTPEREAIIRESEIADGLDDAVLSLLARDSKAVEFRRRRFIYRAGDVADSLYVIDRGRVKICSIEDATGREAVIDI